MNISHGSVVVGMVLMNEAPKYANESGMKKGMIFFRLFFVYFSYIDFKFFFVTISKHFYLMILVKKNNNSNTWSLSTGKNFLKNFYVVYSDKYLIS